jgi:hypothetical protein
MEKDEDIAKIISDMTYSEIKDLIRDTLLDYVRGNNSDETMEILNILRNGYLEIPEPRYLVDSISNRLATNDAKVGRGRAAVGNVRRLGARLVVNMDQILNSGNEIVYVYQDKDEYGVAIYILRPSEGYWREGTDVETFVYSEIFYQNIKNAANINSVYGVLKYNDSFNITDNIDWINNIDSNRAQGILYDRRRITYGVECRFNKIESLGRILTMFNIQWDNMSKEEMCDLLRYLLFKHYLIYFN